MSSLIGVSLRAFLNDIVAQLFSPFYPHLALHDTRDCSRFQWTWKPIPAHKYVRTYLITISYLSSTSSTEFFSVLRTKKKRLRFNSLNKDIKIQRLMSHVKDCKQFNGGSFGGRRRNPRIDTWEIFASCSSWFVSSKFNFSNEILTRSEN